MINIQLINTEYSEKKSASLSWITPNVQVLSLLETILFGRNILMEIIPRIYFS